MRIELCKEILSNKGAFNNTNITDTDELPPGTNDEDDPNDKDPKDPKDTKDPDDPEDPDSPKNKKEKENEKNRRNNFRLKFDKNNTNTQQCPKGKKNKTEPEPFDDNPPVDPTPPMPKPNNDSLPKDTNAPLAYKDDAIEEFWAKMKPLLDTLRSLKSIFMFFF